MSAFVTEYIKDFNGTAAATRAGYSPRTANEQAARLLGNLEIRRAIQDHQAKAIEEAEVSLAWWLKSMKGLASYDPRNFFDENGDLIPVAKLDDVSASAIAGMEVTEVPMGSGGEKIITTIKKIKFTSRQGALDLLGKYLGAYGANNKLEVDVNQMTDDQVESIASSLLKKIK